MSVWIKQINISNFGPLGNRSFDLARLNLIYGPNESGKTFLTEFLLRSIFKYPSTVKWPLRDLPGQGKVILFGLDEKKEISFTPRGREKIEDFWKKQDSGLPPNMARLLVVKGGELSLVQSKDQTNRKFLANAISQDALFDKVLGGIKKNTQNAEIIDGGINGSNVGDIKQRSSLMDQIEGIKQLLSEIEKIYSLGPLREKERTLNFVNNQIDVQEEAKRYLAYQTKEKINSLEKEAIPESHLESMRDLIRDYENFNKEAKDIQDKISIKGTVEDDAIWLEQAALNWEEMKLDSVKKPGKTKLILSTSLILLGFFLGMIDYILSSHLQFSGINIPLLIIAILFFVSGFILNGINLFQFKHWTRNITQSSEREGIIESYRDRFGILINSFADLKVHLNSAKEDSIRISQFRERLSELHTSCERKSNDIQKMFEEYLGEDILPEEWNDKYLLLKKEQGEIEKEVSNLKQLFASLGVREEEFSFDSVEEEYQSEKLEKLLKDRNSIQGEIDKIENNLNGLKQRACQETRDDINEDWSIILEHIQEKLAEKISEYKKITANIIGGIGVTSILQKVKEEEEENIRQGLQSSEVVNILSNVTGHYNNIDIVGDQLLVVGDAEDFDLDSLSTGAKEQLFLAIRMGFASKLAGGSPLFMVFDDAFQHSDWDRRDRLIDVLFRLIELNWQIIYLTMDKHICGICKDMGEKTLGDDFRFYSLEEA
jgi:uncharacterized protein YhaN